jgi:asparagine synthase (glutamine-hydrolysing)
MCGIAGTAGAPPDPALLERMAAQMVRRGPDGSGTWHDAEAGLAHTRLRIIDLHRRSDQPMHLDHLHLVFNGEIYNYRELRANLEGHGHRFKTKSDTEVLLRAWSQWGAQALDRFNGMFAFAIWDDRAAELTLATDPFGEKPLYYWADGERIVFASEIKAILLDPAIERGFNLDALSGFIARGLMPDPFESFFSGIKRLPASHLLRWSKGRSQLERYWSPTPADPPASYADAVAELRELLKDSIRLRLRSDVPVGTSLSGGVDSSAIVALSGELAGEHRRHAFTARFPGYERDEWEYAQQVAGSADVLIHHGVEPDADALLDDLRALVLAQEEPFGSTSLYAQYRVMKAAGEAGVTVLLDGQGGDELFAGYPSSAGYAIRESGSRLAALRSGDARSALASSLGRDFLPSPIARAYKRRAASPYSVAELSRQVATLGPPFEPLLPSQRRLTRELLIETFQTSLPQLLRYADRNSMAWSREVRLPFLDRRIAEFALSLPASYLYERGVTKRIVRDAVRDIVPAAVLDRRDKVAFEPPQATWLARPKLIARIRELLLDRDAATADWLNRKTIERDARSGNWRDSSGIWRALSAELWMRELVLR